MSTQKRKPTFWKEATSGAQVQRALNPPKLFSLSMNFLCLETGIAVSLASLLLVVLLAVYETRYFLKGEIVDRLSVDLTLDEKLIINLNITFSHLVCAGDPT